MKFLVLFSCALAVASAGWTPNHYGGYHIPVIGPNGVPVETPEVQAAKAAHFAAYAGAPAGAPGAYAGAPAHDDGSQNRYYGPHAYQTTHGAAQVTPDGVPLDTPEVAAAKANHFGAFSEALSRAVPHHGHYRRRRGLYAHYPAVHDYNFYGLAADGRPLDTPEVAHAKAAHFAAFNEAAALNGVGHAGYAAYAAPWAHAAVHNGVPADTPEVAAAKAAHFAAHAAAAHGHHY